VLAVDAGSRARVVELLADLLIKMLCEEEARAALVESDAEAALTETIE
jgi:hypothetical protein